MPVGGKGVTQKKSAQVGAASPAGAAMGPAGGGGIGRAFGIYAGRTLWRFFNDSVFGQKLRDNVPKLRGLLNGLATGRYRGAVTMEGARSLLRLEQHPDGSVRDLAGCARAEFLAGPESVWRIAEGDGKEEILAKDRLAIAGLRTIWTGIGESLPKNAIRLLNGGGEFKDNWGLIHLVIQEAYRRIDHPAAKDGAKKVKVTAPVAKALTEARRLSKEAATETAADVTNGELVDGVLTIRQAADGGKDLTADEVRHDLTAEATSQVMLDHVDQVVVAEGGTPTMAEIKPFQRTSFLQAMYDGVSVGYVREAANTLLLSVFQGQQRRALHYVQAGLRSENMRDVARALGVIEMIAPIVETGGQELQNDFNETRQQVIGLMVGAHRGAQRAAEEACGHEVTTPEGRRARAQLQEFVTLRDMALNTLLRVECNDYVVPYPHLARERLYRRILTYWQPRDYPNLTFRGDVIEHVDFISAMSHGYEVDGGRATTLGGTIKGSLPQRGPDGEEAPLALKAFSFEQAMKIITAKTPAGERIYRFGKLFCALPEYDIEEDADANRIARRAVERAMMGDPYVRKLLGGNLARRLRILEIFFGPAPGNATKPASSAEQARYIERITGSAHVFQATGKMSEQEGREERRPPELHEADGGKGTRSEGPCLAEDARKGGIILGRRPFRVISTICTAILATQFHEHGKGMICLLSSDNMPFLNGRAAMADGKPIEQTRFGLYLVPCIDLMEGRPDAAFSKLKDLGQIVLYKDGTIWKFVEKPALTLQRFSFRQATLELDRAWDDHRGAFARGLGGDAKASEMERRIRESVAAAQPGATVEVDISLREGLGLGTVSDRLYSAMLMEEGAFVSRFMEGGDQTARVAYRVNGELVEEERRIDEADVREYHELATEYKEHGYRAVLADRAAAGKDKLSWEQQQAARWKEAWEGLRVGGESGTEVLFDKKQDVAGDGKKTVQVKVEVENARELSLFQLQLLSGFEEENAEGTSLKERQKNATLGQVPVEDVMEVFCRDRELKLAKDLDGDAKRDYLARLALRRGGQAFVARELTNGDTKVEDIDQALTVSRRRAVENLTAQTGKAGADLEPAAIDAEHTKVLSRLAHHTLVMELGEIGGEAYDQKRAVLLKYFGDQPAIATNKDFGKHISDVARSFIHTYINTFNMAYHESLRPYFDALKQEAPASPGVPLSMACGESDWSQRIMEPMRSTREAWQQRFYDEEPVSFISDTKGQKIPVKLEDWMKLWEVSQAIQKASRDRAIREDRAYREAQEQVADEAAEKESSGVGAYIVHQFDDIGSVKEQVAALQRIFDDTKEAISLKGGRTRTILPVRYLYRFLFGLRLRHNFEPGVQLGRVTLTHGLIEAIETCDEGQHTVQGVSFTKQKQGESWRVEIGGVTIEDIDNVYLGSARIAEGHTIGRNVIVLNAVKGRRRGFAERLFLTKKEAAKIQPYAMLQGSNLEGPVEFSGQPEEPTAEHAARLVYGVDHRSNKILPLMADYVVSMVEVFGGHHATILGPISVSPTFDDEGRLDPVGQFYRQDKTRAKKQRILGMSWPIRALNNYVLQYRRRTLRVAEDETGPFFTARTGVQVPAAIPDWILDETVAEFGAMYEDAA